MLLPMSKHILMVLTSNDRLGDTGRTTGWYLPEAAHPWRVFADAGYEVSFTSPQGGRPRMDGVDTSDPIQAEFLTVFGAEGPLTMPSREVDPADYDAVFYVGGHGTMWDLPSDTALASAAAAVYERGGVVAAVCHGPAGLVNIALSDGTPLVSGHRVAAFTNAEEEAVGLTGVVPFLLADALTERGAVHVPADDFAANTVVSDRLITGQNPASATGVAEALVARLSDLQRA
jgi:putative intracellular protease/amidase